MSIDDEIINFIYQKFERNSKIKQNKLYNISLQSEADANIHQLIICKGDITWGIKDITNIKEYIIPRLDKNNPHAAFWYWKG
jgi:hypothetical protein